ncbi:endonuclease domain-containing protein [Aeromicrobium sp.]|uniref:endonuclease domain-containing protein n=1 Tax=Aeromicrobium sp. TaxID=1871063 RepID=UPI003C355DA5
MLPPPLPADRPFTLEYAQRHGHSRRVIQGRRFQIIFAGVYAAADLTITPRLLVQAALLAAPGGCAASHHSGLLLYGIDVGTDLTPQLSTLDPEPIRIRGITMHRLARMSNRSVDGWRVLSPELCLSTAATRLNLVDLVIAADAMYAQRLVTPGRLDHFLHHHHGAGVRKARRAMHLARRGSESPRETYVRVMLELAGLPPLDCNRSFGDENGVLARLDLSWSRWRIAIEYDGRQHGLSLAQREHDIRRRERMERLGWVFVVVTAAQLRRPREIVSRICGTLAARQGWAPLPRFDAEWCALFE